MGMLVLITCSKEQKLQRHTLAATSYIGAKQGWHHYYACSLCGAMRQYGASADRPEGVAVLRYPPIKNDKSAIKAGVKA